MAPTAGEWKAIPSWGGMRGVCNDSPVTSELSLRATSATQGHIKYHVSFKPVTFHTFEFGTFLKQGMTLSQGWQLANWALKFWGRRVPVNFNTAGIYASWWDGLVFEMTLSSQKQTVSEISVPLFHCENGQDIPKLVQSLQCCVVWAEKTSRSDTILWVNTLQCRSRSPGFT